MHVLGLTAFHPGSAAALVSDGELVMVASEERFTRNRHEAAFPRGAVRACLARAGIEPHQLDALVLAEKPSRSFERLLSRELAQYPRTWRGFPALLLSWLGDRLWARSRLAEEVGVPSDRVMFVDSQRARAAWTYFSSPCESAAILVSDEARESAATTLARGEGGRIEVLAEVHDPHALTSFAAESARHLGFAGLEDLARLARLADLGRPTRRAELADVLTIASDGSHVLTLDGLARALGPARTAGTTIEPGGGAYAGAAASVLLVLGDALVAAARELHRRTGLEDLCFGGALAELPSLNARLIVESPFRRIWIPPAPGEAGAAAGAALYAAQVLGAPRTGALEHAFLAEDVLADPEATTAAVDEMERIERAVSTLQAGGLVGWMHGRAEIGRHGLGHRSLLANTRAPGVRERLSRAVGATEDTLDLACAVPAERASDFFDVPAGGQAALRFVALRVRPHESARVFLGAALRAGGFIEPQRVDRRADPLFHALLTRFGERSGAPLLIHVPLCRNGEPTLRREADAREFQRRAGLELLCVGDRVYDGTAAGIPADSPAGIGR